MGIPQTFGQFAGWLLLKIFNVSPPPKRVDIVFDRIVSPSIKDMEREARKLESGTTYKIIGPNRRCPQNFLKELRNPRFKRELVAFLSNAFEDDSFSEIPKDKVLRVTCEANCFIFTSVDGKVLKQTDYKLNSSQEEADNLMILQVSKFPCPATVVI